VRPAPHRVITASTGLVAVGILTAGVWAMAAPRSFYLTIAPYSPYSQHLIRDIGAFQIGLGACLVAGLLVRHALLTVLAGNTAAAVAHSVSHFVDRSAGHASDPATYGAVAVLLSLLTLCLWATNRTPDKPTSATPNQGDPA